MAKTPNLVAVAVANANDRAALVISARQRVLRKRAISVQRTRAARGELAEGVVPQALVKRAGGRGSAGLLVAEGDSWFDYPGTDILAELDDHHGYDVDGVAHHGDRVEAMAYDDGQLLDFSRHLERALRQGRIPSALLLSGGGNDIVGDEFEMLLDHAASPAPGLNQQVVEGVLTQRVLLAYVTILTTTTRICEAVVGRSVRTIIHGYDYPVPDGRGFAGGWGFLPGPWLEPGFRQKGYTNMPERLRLVAALIDHFNEVLATIPRMQEFSHVRYIDLRNTLTTGSGYRKLWANELHPTPAGFSLVAQRFADAIVAP